MPSAKTSKKANLRVQPRMTGSVLGTLEAETPFETLEANGEWYKISLTGFIHKSLVIPLPSTSTTKYLWQNPALKNIPLEAVTPRAITGNASQKRLLQTYNQYGNLLQQVSRLLHLDLSVGLAIICVESGGVGFKDGRMIIRFEPHWFHKLWGKTNQATFDRHFKFQNWKGETHFYRTASSSPWKAFHGDQAKEWTVFEIAKNLNEDAAKQSISMGLGQVMGFNHEKVGYKTATEMFQNFSASVRYQLLGIFDFMTPEMKTTLANKDFVTFAGHYNGSGQATAYGKKIADFVKNWEALSS